MPIAQRNTDQLFALASSIINTKDVMNIIIAEDAITNADLF